MPTRRDESPVADRRQARLDGVLARNPTWDIDPGSRPGYVWDTELRGEGLDRPEGMPAHYGAWTTYEDWKTRRPNLSNWETLGLMSIPFALGGVTALAGGGAAAGGGAGAAGASGGAGAATALPAWATTGVASSPVVGVGAGAGAAGAGAGMSWGTAAVPGGATQAGIGGAGGGMTGWLAKNGLDLALAGMSMLDDDGGGGQERQSFRGHGASDPVDLLNYYIQALQRMGAGLEHKPANKLTGEPLPTTAGGLQVGGAFATDQSVPAAERPNWMSLFQPFQGAAQNQFGLTGGQVPGQGSGNVGTGVPGARRRNPGGSR